LLLHWPLQRVIRLYLFCFNSNRTHSLPEVLDYSCYWLC